MSNMSKYRCVLECVEGTHDPIPLPHKQLVVVGRSKDTRIRYTSVSRQQVELTADCIHKQVHVVQVGTNPCQVDKDILCKGSSAVLKTGLLYLAPSLYPHRAKFSLESVAGGSAAQPNPGKVGKRNISEDSDEDIARKKPKIDTREESDDEERVRKVAENLKFMKQKVKVAPMKQLPQAPAESETCSDVADQQGEPLDRASWLDQDTLLVYKCNKLRASSKIAAFDVDGTIICTQSGKVFPTHAGDWRILYPEVPGCLKKLINEGYKIVFITNQKGIQKGKVKIPEYQQKVQNIAAKLGIPIHLLASKGSGRYRKPGLGMWTHLTKHDNDGIKVNISKSFYVGDAAGRPKDWVPGKKKDFSCGDRLFAINAELAFHTPEEFFQKKSRAKYVMPEFNPRKLDSTTPLLVPVSAKPVSDGQEVIVMVGFPASGKSHFVKEHLVPKGYVHVNRDTQKTWQKCVQLCRESLDRGKSVVVDNTSPDVESRLRYITEAKKKKVPCRCFRHQASLDQAKHNERFREMTDKNHQHINDMIMNSYKSKFTEPALSEGFTEIVKVNLVPKFQDKEQETLYRHYLMEK